MLRLRLTVRRHGVPDVKLIWPCDLTSDPTIAQLLTQINEVIPLESVEWGLEDYALELSDGIGGGFECLHFQTVASTLKNEDQIMIRPLLTDDLKQRKLGGRDQISRDGKHLLDGIAFGRRWLRGPRNRPMLEIPPRKRARLTYPIEDEDDEFLEEGEDEEDEEEDEEEYGSKDEAGTDSDDSVASEDAESTHSESEGSDAEDSSAEDVGDIDEELQLLRRDNADADEAKDTSRSGLLPTLDCVAALQIAFPLLSQQSLKTAFRQQENDIGQAYDHLKKRNDANYSFDEMMDKAVMGLLDSMASESEAEVEGEGPRLLMPPRPLIHEIDEPEARPTSHDPSHITELVDAHMSSDSESETSSSGSSSSESHSDLDSDSDSDSDESFEVTNDSDGDGDTDESSESDTSDDSSSDDESQVSEEPIAKHRVVVSETKGVDVSTQAGEIPVTPGSGLLRTQKRNARRKLAKQMKRLEAMSGDAPAKTPETSQMEDIVGELAARKRALLESVSNSERQSPTTIDPKETETTDLPSVESSKPRKRMDLGAGKRLLFGALGIKPPKSQEDEDKIRQGLMKDVRPVQNARLIEEVVEDVDITDAADETWREKIIYRAVECCHEGVELSEPPFPFVQRWDPQQQYQPSKKRKRKSQQEDNQDEFADYSYLTNGDDTAVELNYDDEAPTGEPAPQEEDDLPALPQDVGALPVLKQDAIGPGIVITWKQLIMSKATNWQPEVKSFTGKIVSSNNNELQLVLAKRDRDGNDKQYDGETGQRIYDKFEVPDMDEDEEDDGNRTLSWEQLTDPRVLQSLPNGRAEQIQSNSETTIELGTSGSEFQMPCAQPIPHLGSMPTDDVFNSVTTDSWTANVEGGNPTAVDLLATGGGCSDVAPDEDVQPTSVVSKVDHTTVPSSIPAPSETGSDLYNLEEDEEPLHYHGRSVSLGDIHDSIVLDTLLNAPATPSQPGVAQDAIMPAMSSSPFPSIEEIFSTAAAMQHTQTSEMAVDVVGSAAAPGPNTEYEEAMRQFDNQEDMGHAFEPQPPASTGRLRSSRSHKSADHPGTSEKPSRKKRKRKSRASKASLFIPEGSQIIQISSSPAREAISASAPVG